MTKAICIASPKGGSGKTVLTATFATLLVSMEKRVLVIDTDAATNGLSLLYLREVMLQREMALSERRQPYGVYEGDKGNSAEIVHLKTGVDLLPATYTFKNTESASLAVYEVRLEALLKLVSPNYDYIFLDAQAGSDEFAHVSMRQGISDEVVIVSEYDPLSAAGVERLKALFPHDLHYMRTWVLLNKMLPEFVQSFSDFMEIARYLSPIPWDSAVVLAYARRRLALDLEFGNNFTLSAIQTLRSLFADDLEKSIEDWSEKRASMLRQPIERQYEDAKVELEALVDRRLALGKMLKIRHYANATFPALPLILGLVAVFGELWKSSIEKESWTFFLLLVMVGVSLAMLISQGSYLKDDDPLLERERYLVEHVKRLDMLRYGSLETLLKRFRSERAWRPKEVTEEAPPPK